MRPPQRMCDMKRLSPILGALAGLCLVGLIPSNAASCCEELREHLSSLSVSDFDQMSVAADGVMDSQSVGKMNAWNNPETGHSGTVQFILRYRSRGNECRKLWYINETSSNTRVTWEVNACLDQDAWALSQKPKRL